MYRVNICTATYNRLELTKQSLPSIMKASSSIPFMLSVVDNGSTDGTVEYLKQLYADKVINNLLLLKENIGVAKAHNVMWALYDNIDYYAKVDNDMLFIKDNWMDDIVNTLDACKDIGALGYNVEIVEYPVVEHCGYPIRIKNGNIGGACFFVPQHAHAKVGYWHEGYDKYGEEDADMYCRLAYLGFKSGYMPDAGAIHLPDIGKEYMQFKVDQRNDNLRGPWHKNTGCYWQGQNIYQASSELNNWRGEILTNV